MTANTNEIKYLSLVKALMNSHEEFQAKYPDAIRKDQTPKGQGLFLPNYSEDQLNDKSYFVNALFEAWFRSENQKLCPKLGLNTSNPLAFMDLLSASIDPKLVPKTAKPHNRIYFLSTALNNGSSDLNLLGHAINAILDALNPLLVEKGLKEVRVLYCYFLLNADDTPKELKVVEFGTGPTLLPLIELNPSSDDERARIVSLDWKNPPITNAPTQHKPKGSWIRNAAAIGTTGSNTNVITPATPVQTPRPLGFGNAPPKTLAGQVATLDAWSGYITNKPAPPI